MRYKAVIKMLLAALCLLNTVAWATTLYVNGVTGSDTNNNCISSLTPCKTIGHAISVAAAGYTIKVAAATYTENLSISFSLNIIGSAASTTIIDGGGVNTAVYISAGRVTVANVTIRHGLAPSGGGIYNKGVLTINNGTVTGNLAFSRSFGYGGGIVNGGTLTITHSTLSGNTAGCGTTGCAGIGGGILNGGTLTINNTTLSGNIAYAHFAYSEGGGIANSGILVISNSTLTGNRANKGGAIFGNAAINNSTVSGNAAYAPGTGGGIYGNPTLQNSIVANSSSGGNCHGTVTSKGYNLSSDGSCNLTGTGDMNNTDPMLGTLGNYGGPTQTIPLLSGSPAIDAGNPSGCTDGQNHLLKTDQRGSPRPDAEDTAGCDMGAYESQSD